MSEGPSAERDRRLFCQSMLTVHLFCRDRAVAQAPHLDTAESMTWVFCAFALARWGGEMVSADAAARGRPEAVLSALHPAAQRELVRMAFTVDRDALRAVRRAHVDWGLVCDVLTAEADRLLEERGPC